MNTRSLLAAIHGAVVLTSCSIAPVTFTPADDAQPSGDGGLDGPGTATITISRDGAAPGVVSAQGLSLECSGTCTAQVAVGATVTLVATPDPGSVFGGWSGDGCAGTDATCTLTVTRDVVIGARFDVAMFTVDVELMGSGSGLVLSTPGGVTCPGVCAMAFPYNTAIELAASPTTTSSFLGWGGPCSGAGTCSFTLTADTHVMAGFAANNDLIVMRVGNGSGTVSSNPAGISCGADCAQGYAPGTVVTLSAAPAADSTFTGWSGGGCSGTGTCQVTMSQAVMVTATFALQKHDLQVARAGAGSGSVSSNPAGISCGTDCVESYDAHTMVTLTAVADPDSTFMGWSGGGCSGAGACVVTMDSAVSVTATFALKSFALTVTLAGTGSGSVQSNPAGISCGSDCTEPYLARTVVTLTPTAGPSSAFAGWSGACSGTGACQVTMSSAKTVTATFSLPGKLVAIDDVTRHLVRIDAGTLNMTDVGPLGATVSYAFGDCAWNAADATLYVVDGRGLNALYRVDLATGAATRIGVHGITDMFSLAYHPPTNRLYGIGGDRQLYTISTTTGVATAIGPTGITNQTFVDGLAWDSTRNVVVALTAGRVVFYAVNLSTGAATQLQSTPFISDLGMTYDPVLDRFLVVDYEGKLIQFDPRNNFARTELGVISGHYTCLALVP
jgi:hypothetical protein